MSENWTQSRFEVWLRNNPHKFSSKTRFCESINKYERKSKNGLELVTQLSVNCANVTKLLLSSQSITFSQGTFMQIKTLNTILLNVNYQNIPDLFWRCCSVEDWNKKNRIFILITYHPWIGKSIKKQSH